MSSLLDSTSQREAVVTRLDPPPASPVSLQKPLVFGAAGDGWTPGRIALLLALFVAPSLAATLYYGLAASDIYVSESQFVVRSQGQGSPGLIEGMGEGSAISVGATDVNSVISYIGSRDALNALAARIDIRKAYGAENGDALARFPGLFRRDTAEDLFAYYTTHVTADHDKAKGVTTLAVSAFDPGTAQAISRILLEEAERIVNGLSERMRQDTLAQAEKHVETARAQLLAAQQALQDWRSRERQYDPALYSKSVVEVVTSLSIAIAEAKAKRQELQTSSPRNPEITSLDTKIETLNAQIRDQWLSLAGENASLAPQISAYERLVIDRELAVKLYAAANESLEQARSEARRQSVFVERISEPQSADKPRHPRRWLNTLLVAALAFMAFVVVDRFAANLRRHRQLADYASLKGTRHG